MNTQPHDPTTAVFEKETVLNVSATRQRGELITIPKGELLLFGRDLPDWRRVVVEWKNERVTISRTAWESCKPLT